MKQPILLSIALYSFICFAQTTDNMKPAGKGPDQEFVNKATNGGMMEVALGKYAQQNASSPRVKDFGAMMERDHSKTNAELKSVAEKGGMTAPSSMDASTKSHTDKMMMNKGADFDKAYIDMMVNDHQKDIGEFERAEKNCKDAGLRSFISNTLPTLRMHLDSAKAIQASVK